MVVDSAIQQGFDTGAADLYAADGVPITYTESHYLMKKETAKIKSSEELLLDSAERLIGRHGYEGVSLRQISQAAGSANNSAIHYYFKNKDGLIREIIKRRAAAIDERRQALLASLREEKREHDPAAIMEVLLRPIADERDAEGNCPYAAFLLALRVLGDITHWQTIADSPRLTRQLYNLLKKSLAGIPREVVEMRFLAAFTVFLIAIVDWDLGKIHPKNRVRSREKFLQLSLDYAIAGVVAPYLPR